MCGIAGILGGDWAPDQRRSTVERMVRTLRLRGPDDHGVWSGDDAAIGMARLSIIDLAGGHQPIPNEDATRWVVQNGEIYNYRELTAQLAGHGHQFRTQSDTEAILHGFEQWGTELPTHLRGMFACALWDTRQRSGLLAVDRLGIKPLYYAWHRGGLLFGSELKAILAAGLDDGGWDWDAISLYLAYGTIPAPFSIYRAVRKLPPAHRLHWHAGRAAIEPYWDLPASPRGSTTGRPSLDDLRATLQEAVTSHLVADVPVGAFLSGGIDSSSVVAFASMAGAQRLKTFTIGFPVTAFDERPLARAVAARYQTEHHELVVEPESIAVLPSLLAYFDEPFADSSAVPTYFVAKLARQHVKVALSGDGGDEIFLGYKYFLSTRLAQRIRWVPRAGRRGLAALLAAAPPLPGYRLNRSWELARRRVGDCLHDPIETYVRKLRNLPADWVDRLIKPEVAEQISSTAADQFLAEIVKGRGGAAAAHSLDPYGYAALKFSLASDMLVKVDRMSMMNSLEVRVPLLDHRLVEYVTAIPERDRFPQARLKGLLRDAVAPLLPAELVTAPKTGFSMPVARWFRDDAVGFVADVLLGDDSTGSLFRREPLERLIDSVRSGNESLGGALWTVLAFELWRTGARSG